MVDTNKLEIDYKAPLEEALSYFISYYCEENNIKIDAIEPDFGLEIDYVGLVEEVEGYLTILKERISNMIAEEI